MSWYVTLPYVALLHPYPTLHRNILVPAKANHPVRTVDNASNLDAKGREEYGISKKLPKSLDESLFALMHDLELKDMMGHDFVRKYAMVKKAEKALLRDMSPERRRVWLMERY